VPGGRGGAVVIVQRFGSALNLNVHMHALVLDGVYAEDSAGTLGFHPTGTPTEWDLEAVVSTLERRITRVLTRRGLTETDEAAPVDAWHLRSPSGPRGQVPSRSSIQSDRGRSVSPEIAARESWRYRLRSRMLRNGWPTPARGHPR
jgi:hypothetical protein